MNEQQQPSALGDGFDRAFRALNGRADVIQCREANIPHVHPVTEVKSTYLVQTVRARDRGDGTSGDTIFLQHFGPAGGVRLALPPEVADVIARQRDALSTKSRKAAGRERAARDKAAGKLPGFLRGGPKRKPKKKPKPGEEK